MVTYNCICFDCEGNGRFQIDSEDTPENIICPVCGSNDTKILGQECIIFGKIASMSVQDRQNVLKKRSHEHFKKNIKDKKNELLGRVFKEMKQK